MPGKQTSSSGSLNKSSSSLSNGTDDSKSLRRMSPRKVNSYPQIEPTHLSVEAHSNHSSSINQITKSQDGSGLNSHHSNIKSNSHTGTTKKLNFHLTYLIKETHGKHLFGLSSNWGNCNQAYRMRNRFHVAMDDAVYVATVGGQMASIYMVADHPASHCPDNSESEVSKPETEEAEQVLIEPPDNSPPLLLMQSFLDPHPEEDFFCCAWSRGPIFSEALGGPDPSTAREQVLAVAGKRSVIRLLVPSLSQCSHTLIGHGQSINHLAFHPRDPSLLFSFSKDYNIRLWNIATNALVAIFGGAQGHRAEILHGSVHLSGRYVVSGGMDHAIKIWRLDEEELMAAMQNSHKYDHRNSKRPFQTVLQHFPELCTRKAHRNYVDCCLWYGNLVLSKSCEESVSIWKPGGAYTDETLSGPPSPNNNDSPRLKTQCTTTVGNLFSSRLGNDMETENSNCFEEDSEELIQFHLGHQDVTLLHELDASKCDIWYIRMDIDMVNHVLALGNSCGKIYLWDLEIEDIFQINPQVLSLNRAGVTGAIRQVHFTNQGKTLLCVCDNGYLARFDRE